MCPMEWLENWEKQRESGAPSRWRGVATRCREGVEPGREGRRGGQELGSRS